MFAVVLVPALRAQIRQPLNIPPTVGSVEYHTGPYMPNTPASVTSISPYNFNTPRSFNNGYRNGGRGNGCKGYGCGSGYAGYGYGYTYAIPYSYVYPAYDPGYDTGGGGGPYLYSGPPGPQTPPAEQTLHIIVDQVPQKHVVREDELADAEPMPAPQHAVPDAKPGEPTTLVYKDGHKQQVTNYAIMGQTLYVFDERTKKIALADLDIPATIQVNEDEGVEFQVPKTKQPAAPKKSSGVPLQSLPEEGPKTSSSLSTTP